MLEPATSSIIHPNLRPAAFAKRIYTTQTMADFASPIPILLCGKLETHIQATMDIVKPEFQGKMRQRQI